MLFGFDTENKPIAEGALLVYSIYKSRDAKRGPSGYDMWDQIERFTRRAAKRADDVGGFLKNFKPMMACGTINPRWCGAGTMAFNAMRFDDGSIMVRGEGTDTQRDFMLSITEAPEEDQKAIVEMLYEQTQRIILLVRDRLEREKPFESKFTEKTED